MILVAGATGYLGGEICRRLTTAGRPVRALVRKTSDPSIVARLRELGAEIIEGDLREPASLERACRGATAVVSTVTITRSRQPGDSLAATDEQGQLALVEAAEAAGAGKFVYISFSGGLGGGDALTHAKRAVEQRLARSGMRWTVLRPSFFMEVWLGPALGFDYANARATIYGSGEQRMSWISLGDVAACAVMALDNPATDRQMIELGGPEAVSPLEVVRIFEETGGRPFEVQHFQEEALRAQAVTATDEMDRTFATLMLGYVAGDEIPMDETLRRFPMKLTSVEDYAQAALSQGAAQSA